MPQSVYTARQAIFNRKVHVVAYELLFRDGEENRFPNVDPHEATSKLILRTHLNEGLSAVTMGKRALINFSEKCLLSGLAEMLPKEDVIIEILETVTPSEEVFQKCRELFHAGYMLALDDFIYKKEWLRFIPLVKLIKFDISKTPLLKIKPLIDKLKERKNLRLLAERVETQEEFKLAKEMGFQFFQGYFFCKPEMRKSRDINVQSATLVSLYHELSRPQLNIVKISAFFEQDVGLTYKLLKYINSGILPLKTSINSIKQALIYLGESQIRKLVALLTTAELAKNKPKEIIRLAIVRARSAELAMKKVVPSLSEEAFLAGLLSLIGAMLDRPIEQIISELPVSDAIKEALIDESCQSPLRVVLNAVTLYEKGSWHLTTLECQKIRLPYDLLATYYQDALVWAKQYENIQEPPLDRTA